MLNVLILLAGILSLSTAVLRQNDSIPTMTPHHRIKLIIDTDGVSDDIRAISLAMQHPDVEVIAFTTVHGCVSVEQATANVARAQRANNVGKPIPIYKGSATALIRIEHKAEEEFFFGKDGIGDQPEAFPPVKPTDFTAHEAEPAALALIRLTRLHPDATVVCLGPLTNLALALKLDPNFAQQPERMVIMGGNYYGIGNVDSSSSSEFNFHGDPEAASVVLKEMESPITVVPWEAFFLEGPIHEKEVDFEAHLKYDTHLASFLSTATSIGRQTIKRNDRQYTYCDEIAVSVAIDPERVVKKHLPLRVIVELSGKHTRGQVVVDWVDILWKNETVINRVETNKLNRSKDKKIIDFVTSYDVKVVDAWLHNAVQGLPGPW